MNPSRDELRERLRQHLTCKKGFRTESKSLFLTSNENTMRDYCTSKRKEIQLLKQFTKADRIITSGLSISEL